MTYYHNLIMLMTVCVTTNAQVKITNTSNQTPNTDAILHLESQNNDKGLLLSRVALTSTVLATPLSSHENGIIVYNTATTTGSNLVTPGLYYNDGTKWIKLSKNEKQFGDIKHSYQSSDHNGWYLLNGRLTSTLSATSKAVANSLNFTTNLPNANDQLLKNKTSSQSLGTLSGVNTITLTQANLPNLILTGNITDAGAHSHTYNDNPTITQTALAGTNNPLLGTTETFKTTVSSGDHNHTLSFTLGGNSTAFSVRPKTMITNIFIYLGN